MKRNAKQDGSGGRLRLGLLLASVAAFLLVPAAAASAVENAHVEIEGTGSGKVIGVPPLAGTPAIECEYESPGPEEGTCDAEAVQDETLIFFEVEPEAAPGSYFAGWEVTEGNEVSGYCESGSVSYPNCRAFNLAVGQITVKATFNELILNVHIITEGEGSGEILGDPGLTEGNPRVECAWNGETEEQTGDCDVEAGEAFGFAGINVFHEAAEGSVFGGWELVEGTLLEPSQCETMGSNCSAIIFAEGEEIIIKAVFAPAQPLTLETSGAGTGSFECEDVTAGTPAAPCESGDEFAENNEVNVTPVAGANSVFAEFNSENGGECSGATCTVTMSGPRTVNAQFDLETFTFGTTVEGEGTVKCNGVACASEYAYGDEIEVVATPNSVAYILDEISGTGSASGCTASPCTFTVEEASSVTASFKTAAYKDEAEVETVHGEVLETTTLDGAGCEDVDLTPGESSFLPGVTDDYSNTCTVVLTSTGAESTFTASDPSAVHTGHLVNEGGAYFLPSPLEVKAEDSQGNGSGPGLTALSPVTMLTFGVPIGADTTTLTFNQHIDAEDGLHTGEYSKTILLTLAQTA